MLINFKSFNKLIYVVLCYATLFIFSHFLYDLFLRLNPWLKTPALMQPISDVSIDLTLVN